MEDFFPYLPYVAVKYASYASWCLVGVLWFAPDRGYLRGDAPGCACATHR